MSVPTRHPRQTHLARAHRFPSGARASLVKDQTTLRLALPHLIPAVYNIPLDYRDNRGKAEHIKRMIEQFWREEKKRFDVVVWTEYDGRARVWLVRSNLVDGLPRPVRGVRASV